MKRDYKCVEYILDAVEKCDYPDIDLVDLVSAEYDSATIRYHVALMREAGLIVVYNGFSANFYEEFGGTIKRLTWTGHDMLDALRAGHIIRVGY